MALAIWDLRRNATITTFVPTIVATLRTEIVSTLTILLLANMETNAPPTTIAKPELAIRVLRSIVTTVMLVLTILATMENVFTTTTPILVRITMRVLPATSVTKDIANQATPCTVMTTKYAPPIVATPRRDVCTLLTSTRAMMVTHALRMITVLMVSANLERILAKKHLTGRETSKKKGMLEVSLPLLACPWCLESSTL